MPRIRIRHHVNPLLSGYLHTGARAVPVPARGEVEVELGCADAAFLFDRAASHPDLTCIGVEIRRDLVVDVNERAREAGLPNLRAVFANINADLHALFADQRLDRVFINFPDPWFKTRHHKRRVMTPEVAELLHCKIAPGGTLFFQSDVFDLALDAMAILEDSELFANVNGPWTFARANPYGARSLREIRCDTRGWRVWRMLYSPRR